VFFCDFRLRHTIQELTATKWLNIDQNNVRIGTAKAVARLMSFAQITSNFCVTSVFTVFCDTYTYSKSKALVALLPAECKLLSIICVGAHAYFQ